MKTKYEITMIYHENKSHSIVENWNCKGENKLKKILCESLDVLKDSEGFVVKPDLEVLTKNLSRYADKETIEDEFKRMTKAYKCYKNIMENISYISSGTYTIKLDKDVTYNIVKEI